MEGLGTLLVYALLFYLMMRFGCGAHMIHGHGGHGSKQESDSGTFIDPVCGKEVDQNKGYGWYIALIWVPIYNVFALRSSRRHKSKQTR